MKFVRYDQETKNVARKLRKKGLSYGEIAHKIGTSKSTIKLWCNDINLSPKLRKRLYSKQIEIMSKGPQSSHERRKREIQEIVKNAESEIKLPIDGETYKLAGAALYWAEGSKTEDFCITNSDPHLIKFMVQWLINTFNISSENFQAHLNIYPQQNDQEIKKFWSKITNIPLKNFGKSFIKPISKGYKKNTLYYGTIKIRVRKGTNLRHRVFGWINVLLKNNNLEISEIERKWHKLKEYKRP